MKWIKKMFFKFLHQNDEELKIMMYINSLDKNDSYNIKVAQSYKRLSNGISIRLGREGDYKETLSRIKYYTSQYEKYRNLHIDQNKDGIK